MHFSYWDHLILDGSGICYGLYFNGNFNGELGGEYDKFSLAVEKFFKKADFRNPIVVMDGCAGNDVKKLRTSLLRRTESMNELQRVQASNSARGKSIKPLLIISVFMDVLRSLNITFLVADGEADNMVAALANHYSCPVLSNDSDYYMFKLEQGFIHYDRYYKDRKGHSLFVYSDFMKQFSLSDHELCLVLPAVFGNDFIEPTAPRNDFGSTLRDLSKYHSCKEYLESKDSVVNPNSFKAVKKFYCDDMCLPPDYFEEFTTSAKFAPLPEWVFSSFKKGCFPPYLLNVYHNKSCLFPVVVEVVEKDSAWLISRDIRQYLYGFVGLRENDPIREGIRQSFLPTFTEQEIFPKFQQPDVISIGDRCFSDKNERKQSDFVLAVLSCNEMSSQDVQQFNALDGKWKLPIAATYYWYRHLTTPPPQSSDASDGSKTTNRNLVKSLLLSFLTCSKLMHSGSHLRSRPIAPKTRSDHLIALHSFAQWQCVYFDCKALNYVAREPFPTTSPASLYSGEVAMHYASISCEGVQLDGFLKDGSDEKTLYSSFLYLVTGRSEEERMGKHVVSTKKCFLK